MLRRWIPPMLLSVSLGCGLAPKVEDLIAKIDAKVDGVAATAKASVDTLASGVHAVESRVSAMDATLNATAKTAADKGAPVDQGGSAFAGWLAKNPTEISTATLGLLAALYAGWKRKQAADAQGSADAAGAVLSAAKAAVDSGADVKAHLATALAANPDAAQVLHDAASPT